MNMEQEFFIDKLTNSIQNTISGDSFQTEVIRIGNSDLKIITKQKGWNFVWQKEFKDIKKEVYKLTIVNNSSIIQGLLSLSIENGFIYINLLESAPFNIGKGKLYEGVPGNLVAYACKLSFQKGFDGCVAFVAKSKLVSHYEQTLGAYHFGNQRMIIETKASKKLVEKYFKE